MELGFRVTLGDAGAFRVGRGRRRGKCVDDECNAADHRGAGQQHRERALPLLGAEQAAQDLGESPGYEGREQKRKEQFRRSGTSIVMRYLGITALPTA